VKQRNCAVIGAGPMGLACGLELLKQGHQVTIYEAADCIGGMTATFNFDGLDIERYYHFLCLTDYPLFDLLKDLGIEDTIRWKSTKMGFFYDGKLYKWGTPFSLLAFPKLDLISKVRYGIHVLATKNTKDWTKLDKVEATSWLQRWLGQKGYDILWKSLFELKFFEYTENLSAAWIGTRIQRVANSRKNLLQEQMGYLTGGSKTFLDAIEAKIMELGGTIKLSSPINSVEADDLGVIGVITNNDYVPHDTVISTAPLQYVPKFASRLSEKEKEQINAIKNIAVACVILKLEQPLSENFWMNINDSSIEVPGVIEYSNLNSESGEHIVYVPYYMPQSHPKYSWSDEELFAEVRGYLQRVGSSFDPTQIKAQVVSRYEYAQTICPPNFYDALPSMRTSLSGFYMADTSYYYPEDRSISESVATGLRLANKVLEDV